MPHPIITGLILLAVAAVATAGWLAKSEMDNRDENGDPIEKDEQR